MGRSGSRFAGLARGDVKKRGVMNKTEARYAAGLEQDPEVLAFWYEPANWRLTYPPKGDGERAMTYTPDFMVLYADGVVAMDDVKGSGPPNDASIVRIKAAAELIPCFKWRLCTEQAKKKGGGFVRRVL